MKLLIAILLSFLLGILVTSCSIPGNKGQDVNSEIELLKNQNQSLIENLVAIKNQKKQQEDAIFQYITFIDSVDNILNSIYSELTLFTLPQEGKSFNHQSDLLGKLRMLNERLQEANDMIYKLEEKLISYKNNSAYSKKLIQYYKNENEKQKRKIEDLQIIIKNQQQIIISQKTKIEKQTKELSQKQNLLDSKDRIISKQNEILNNRSVLLLNQSKLMEINLKENNILVPEKRNKIILLNASSEMYKIEKINRNVSRLWIAEQFWEENRFLVVSIKNKF